jgi:hypothetical protein
VRAVIVLKPLDLRLKFSSFLSCSYDDFSDMSIRCSKKYVKGGELYYLFDFGYRNLSRGIARFD